MKFIVKNEKLELKYIPDYGSWTFHIQIPNTESIEGKWGTIKVSGTIDDYEIKSKNLLPMASREKILAVNGNIRKAINKKAGDILNVTLSLDTVVEEINEKSILKTFEESDVLGKFKDLPQKKQKEILAEIIFEKSDKKKIDKMVEYIDSLNK